MSSFGHQMDDLLKLSHNGFIDLDLFKCRECWHDHT